MNYAGLEYSGVRNIDGPLVFIDGIRGVAYDELVEITPTHIRIRKKELDAANRLRAAVRARNAQK